MIIRSANPITGRFDTVTPGWKLKYTTPAEGQTGDHKVVLYPQKSGFSIVVR